MSDSMGTDRDVNRLVRSWLHEDRHEDADRVLGAVMDHVDATPQHRPSQSLRRIPTMNRFLAFGLGAAAVVMAALIGLQLLGGSAPGGPPNESGVPTSSPEPYSADSEPLPSDAVSIGPLEAGTYTAYDFEGSGRNITFTVPDGWTWGTFVLTHRSTGSYVGFWSTQIQVYGDPCQWEGTEPDPPTGGSAIDLVMALAAQPMRSAQIGGEIAVDGPEGPNSLSGFSVEISVPDDIVLADCDQGQFRSWGPAPYERYHQSPGQWDHIWAVDDFADGDRIVIDMAGSQGIDPDLVEVIRAIVDSVALTPAE